MGAGLFSEGNKKEIHRRPAAFISAKNTSSDNCSEAVGKPPAAGRRRADEGPRQPARAAFQGRGRKSQEAEPSAGKAERSSAECRARASKRNPALAPGWLDVRVSVERWFLRTLRFILFRLKCPWLVPSACPTTARRECRRHMICLVLEVDRLREAASGGPRSHLGLVPMRFRNPGRRFNGIKPVRTLGAGEMHFACGLKDR